MATREDHQATRDQSKQHIQAHDWSDGSSDFVLVQDVTPPVSSWRAQRMLMCRLYLGLIQTISDDYGAEFVARSRVHLANRRHLLFSAPSCVRPLARARSRAR